MKHTLLCLSLLLTALTTLVSCDSKEVVALAVETANMSKATPILIGECTIDIISYDRDENIVYLNVRINPAFPDSATYRPIEKADAIQETELLLRTSKMTKLLVAMVNTKAVLRVDVAWSSSSTGDFYYTPEQLKVLYDAPQLTANEYAAQSMAVNHAILNKSCPLPFLYNTMLLEKVSANDSVITYEIIPNAKTDKEAPWTFSKIVNDRTGFETELLNYIKNILSGWHAFIKTAWELERTLRFTVKDPASSRTVSFDFPARTSLYWIINPR